MAKHYKKRKTKYTVQNVRLYNIWYGMLERCRNSLNPYYHRYGGRGVVVCDEWNDYESFSVWAISNGYADELSLDRIDNNGNYDPTNCRWVTKTEQHYNTSQNRYETINGVTKCVSEWAKDYGIRYGLVLRRLSRGLTIEEALTREVSKTNVGLPVRCINTGEIFPSAKAAAEKYGRTTSAIARASRTGRMSCGMRWEQLCKSEKSAT